jgi:hypothetical protein
MSTSIQIATHAPGSTIEVRRTATSEGNMSMSESTTKSRVEVTPAIFCNRFHVSVNSRLTKITFAEELRESDEVVPVTSIVVETGDALTLAKLILRVAEENRAKYPEAYQTSESR